MARLSSQPNKKRNDCWAIVLFISATAATPGVAAEPAAKALFKDLLAPPAANLSGPALSDNPGDIPEAHFWAPRDRPMAYSDVAKVLAEVRKLNSSRADGFIELLRAERRDLAGLPFAMGGACRTSAERSRRFKEAALLARETMSHASGHSLDQQAKRFWDAYTLDNFSRVGALVNLASDDRGHVVGARRAVLQQILAPESAQLRRGLVNHLAEATDAEATRGLARLALFSEEQEVRVAAIAALKSRPADGSTDVLTRGLAYPWPPVVQRAADALAQLGRTDLAPQLVDMLESPDPRAPALQNIDGKPTPVVRELVRLNHQCSCHLCHAPADADTPKHVLLAQASIPDMPPPSLIGYYHQSDPVLLVRVDVTYLRQDFSIMLPIPNAPTGTKKQRFDFVVRERALTEKEADQYCETLERHEPGNPPPHRTAALEALRKLTGKDAGPSAQAWRDLLKLQASTR